MENIKELSIKEITEFVKSINDKPFRAKQIYEWLWKKNVSSFDEMKNIPKKIIDVLKSTYEIKLIKITYSVKSIIDYSSKFAFITHDKLFVEGVLIPSGANSRVTACISTQVGCSLGCKFCATGTMGLTRNLTAAEIYEQVFLLNIEAEKLYQRKLTNIVVMGMGEPLLNYDNLLRALDFVTSENGLSMSASRITVSTVGLVKQIKKLAEDEPKFNLAVSLHTARNEQRSEIMPVNVHNSIPELISALKYFNNKTGKRITFEYLLIDGITDTKEDAVALAEFCKNFPSKINLIEFNPVQHINYKTSIPYNTLYFKEFLENKNLVVTVRKSKGQDINAACGQLALIKQDK
ncbi:MAG: 23S rRNA (adenine(2503)-C(2))-methyltransferase RlmN [Bacteroidales bacterium]|nr:23S rRNA (adenine(2503)-C(2))-methyltransferase RlmN [Bacteroidales bacterium]